MTLPLAEVSLLSLEVSGSSGVSPIWHRTPPDLPPLWAPVSKLDCCAQSWGFLTDHKKIWIFGSHLVPFQQCNWPVTVFHLYYAPIVTINYLRYFQKTNQQEETRRLTMRLSQGKWVKLSRSMPDLPKGTFISVTNLSWSHGTEQSLVWRTLKLRLGGRWEKGGTKEVRKTYVFSEGILKLKRKEKYLCDRRLMRELGVLNGKLYERIKLYLWAG